ncbi:MAG: GNAT family N-acetyltransferase [Pseudomonadota bacterium]
MTTEPLEFRPLKPDDWPDVWSILQPAFAAGGSYPCPIDMAELEAKDYWCAPHHLVFVADSADLGILGTYYLRTDQGGLGDHICNCGYVVAETARRHGVGRAMCRHSQDVARQNGYSGMRFNLVVETNAAGINAWIAEGFEIVGTVPNAFRHKADGLVGAHIMYKALTE